MTCPKCSATISRNDAFCEACGAPITPKEAKDPLIGKVLLNQYIIRRKLGEGGFGAVYEADQPSMDRKVAIKTLHRHLFQNFQAVARFRREGVAASRLKHPAAVQMYNFGETEDGVLWMAMEFLEGPTLDQRIREGGPFSPEELVEILGPVCEVLQEAHQKGIVHRDLKPENIMLVPFEGKMLPEVLDFGIAGLLEDDSVTKSGMISGTPAYMSPEQWKGLRHTDPRSDIYSLGMIAYQCLSGRLPFEADTAPAWMQKHCLEAPLDLRMALSGREIAPGFEAAIMKALAKEPEERFPSAMEFLHALQEGLGKRVPSAPEAKTETLAPPPPLRAPRRRLWPWLAALGALLLVGGGFLLNSLVFSGADTPPSPEPTIAPAPSPETLSTSSSAPAPPCTLGDPKGCQARCDQQDAASCATLGVMYEDGRGLPRDYTRAAKLYQAACEIDASRGCCPLGILYEEGKGVPKDTARAQELYQKACEAKDPSGCNYLGLLYAIGVHVPKDTARAATLYQKACDGGWAAGCVNLGAFAAAGEGVPKDAPRAITLYQKACDLGHPAGCSNLGFMYATGNGVPRDDSKAASLYQKACEAGEPGACSNLGASYEEGRGVSLDLSRAKTLYQQSCDGGWAMGCKNLGNLYIKGEGVSPDPARGYKLQERACDLGEGSACYTLGLLYETGGPGTPQDRARAKKLFQRGCDLGNRLACLLSPSP